MKEVLEVFKDFAYMYDQSIDMVNYKYHHSLRVMDISEIIAKNLKLDDENIKLAKFIGLTHDIARFEQWTKYQTFYDKVSFDHGLRATEILFEEKMIEKFSVKNDYNVIETAIFNHNKLLIGSDVIDEKELLHSKIIRDADKIDIIYSFSTDRILEIGSDDSEISSNVKKDFFSNTQIEYADIITPNDRIIEIISLLYDINFKCSLEYIKEKGYLKDLFENLKHKEIFEDYFEHMNKYIEIRRKELC